MEKLFEQFKLRWNKQYESDKEELHRFKIFAQNYQRSIFRNHQEGNQNHGVTKLRSSLESYWTGYREVVLGLLTWA